VASELGQLLIKFFICIKLKSNFTNEFNPKTVGGQLMLDLGKDLMFYLVP